MPVIATFWCKVYLSTITSYKKVRIQIKTFSNDDPDPNPTLEKNEVVITQL